MSLRMTEHRSVGYNLQGFVVKNAFPELTNLTSIVPVCCYGQHKLFPTSIKMIHIKCM
jgi:hypothetical protein